MTREWIPEPMTSVECPNCAREFHAYNYPEARNTMRKHLARCPDEKEPTT